MYTKSNTALTVSARNRATTYIANSEFAGLRYIVLILTKIFIHVLSLKMIK